MKYLYILLSMVLIAGMPLFSQIEVEAPNGGEAYFRHHTKKIQWKTGNIRGNVRIRLVKGNTGIGNIVDSTPNDGQYEWKIDKLANGQAILTGTDYKVKVVLISNNSIKDISNDYFSIKPFLKPGSFKDLLPDLRIQINVVDSPATYPSLIQASIRNNGKVKTLKNTTFTVTIYSLGIDGQSPPTHYFSFPTGSINKILLPGERFSWAMQYVFTEPGKYMLKGVVDDANKIKETEENNNTNEGEFWIEKE